MTNNAIIAAPSFFYSSSVVWLLHLILYVAAEIGKTLLNKNL